MFFHDFKKTTGGKKCVGFIRCLTVEVLVAKSTKDFFPLQDYKQNS